MVLSSTRTRIAMTLRALLCTLALAATPAAFAALKAGDPAPAFSAPASLAGKPFTYSLKDGLAKGPVVVYFYPSAYTARVQHPGAQVLDQGRPVRRRRRHRDRRLARQHRAAERVLGRPRLLRRQAGGRVRRRRQDRARLRPAGERRAARRHRHARQGDRPRLHRAHDLRRQARRHRLAAVGGVSPEANVARALELVRKLSSSR